MISLDKYITITRSEGQTEPEPHTSIAQLNTGIRRDNVVL